MIRARAVFDADANLRSFEAEGHAEAGERGYDPVCAAFTVLARTAYRALEALPGVELAGTATRPGKLRFEVLATAASAERAAGIADFLVTGMRDLARDYPAAVNFAQESKWRE